MLWTRISNYVTIGLGAALLATSIGWYTTNVRLTYTKYELKAEKLGRKNDRLIYKGAQKEAEVKSLNKVLEVERKNVELANKADQDYSALLRKYNDSLLRYQASQRPSGGIHMSSTSTTSDGSHFTSENTEISISLNDAGICAENTARIQAVHDWAGNLGFKDVVE